MTTTHPTDRTAACGECWSRVAHVPSCSAAPEYGPGDPAPAVLIFDRDGRERAEWEHADRSIDAGEYSRNDEPTPLDEAFHDPENPGRHRLEPAGLGMSNWRCSCGARFTTSHDARNHIRSTEEA